MKTIYLTLAALMGFCVSSPVLAIDFGMVNVTQNDVANNPTSVSINVTQNTPGFQIIGAGTNRGDYTVQIGATNADDQAGGVLLTSVAQNGVDHGQSDGFLIGTSSIDRTAGGYFIPLHAAPGGGEYNSNVSAVYFPFAEGWVAGHAYNSAGPSANGQPNNVLNATPGINLGTQFIDNGGGQSTVNLPNAHSGADGILFVNGGKNEDNYALVRGNATGNWTIFNHDNGSQGAAYEQDPVAFAYIPLGTPNVTMGTVTGSNGVYLNQGDFTIQNTGTGTFQLEIDGFTNADGTLLVTAHGGVSNNVDNIITFQPTGTGWEIQTRDLPQNPPTLQNNGLEPTFSFAFLPTSAPPAGPGASPTTQFNPDAVAGGNIVVTEFNPANDEDSIFARVAEGSRGLGTYSSNRADITLSFGGEAMSANDGVLLGTISQNSRETMITGPTTTVLSGTISPYADSSNRYVVATAPDAATQANSLDGTSEHNVNFNVVYFPPCRWISDRSQCSDSRRCNNSFISWHSQPKRRHSDCQLIWQRRQLCHRQCQRCWRLDGASSGQWFQPRGRRIHLCIRSFWNRKSSGSGPNWRWRRD